MTFYHFLRIVEIRTKVVSVSSLLVGTLWTVWAETSFDWTAFALLAGAVLAIDMGTTAFNTFFDYLHGVDHPALNRERDKVLVHDGVAPGVALLVSILLYGVGGVVGLFLAARIGWFLVPVGIASMAVGFVYNAGPLPISRTPFGEVFAGGFLGWVLVEISLLVHSGSLVPESLLSALLSHGALWAGVPSAVMVASILTVNNTCDIDGDRASGRVTLSILIGRAAGEALIYLEGAATLLTVVLLAVWGVFPRAVIPTMILAGIFAVIEYRRMHRRGYSHETKGPSMGSISRVFTVFTIAMLSGFAAGILQNG